MRSWPGRDRAEMLLLAKSLWSLGFAGTRHFRAQIPLPLLQGVKALQQVALQASLQGLIAKAAYPLSSFAVVIAGLLRAEPDHLLTAVQPGRVVDDRVGDVVARPQSRTSRWLSVGRARARRRSVHRRTGRPPRRPATSLRSPAASKTCKSGHRGAPVRHCPRDYAISAVFRDHANGLVCIGLL
jgi:hypothetical protein